MDVFEKLAADLSGSVADLCVEIKRQKALADAQDQAIEGYAQRAAAEVCRLRKEVVRLNNEVEQLHGRIESSLIPGYGVMDVVTGAVDLCKDAYSTFAEKQ